MQKSRETLRDRELMNMSREALRQKANELDLMREVFAKLSPEEQLERALHAGYLTAHEYARKKELRLDERNKYREYLNVLDEKR